MQKGVRRRTLKPKGMNDHEQGSRRWPKSAAQSFKKFQNEAELPGATRNADGHIIGITAGGWTNEQIAQVVVEAYLRGAEPPGSIDFGSEGARLGGRSFNMLVPAMARGTHHRELPR